MDYIGGLHFTSCRYQRKHHLSFSVFLAFNLLFMDEPTCTTHNTHFVVISYNMLMVFM